MEASNSTDPDYRELVAAALAGDGWGPPSEPLTDPHWTPDLVTAGQDAVLLVQSEATLKPFIEKRLQRAAEVGLNVHLACPLDVLYEDATLTALSTIHPVVLLIEDANVADGAPLLRVLAMEDVQVAPATFKELAKAGLELAKQDGQPHEKGRRFESVLAFMLSQVEGFRVTRTNYRTSSEEIDIVLRQLSTSGRVWSRHGPFLLTEAKNHKDGVSQQMFSTFRTKMETKRGQAKLGFLVSRTTVSEDARKQEAKTAMGDIAIVFIDGEDLTAWLEAPDYNEWLEAHIEAAVLD